MEEGAMSFTRLASSSTRKVMQYWFFPTGHDSFTDTVAMAVDCCNLSEMIGLESLIKYR
ncbi:hypothetical protein LNP74_32160 [Klebsiella pneumoniae subsp. pneumoniae]|nr:hypothetical protein [Klebsiella pneumoniae subsp. pneumoniae]